MGRRVAAKKRGRVSVFFFLQQPHAGYDDRIDVGEESRANLAVNQSVVTRERNDASAIGNNLG